MDTFRREILELIAAHEGTYSWYQIDRALTSSARREEFMPLMRGLVGVLRELEADGLITAGAGHHPSQPVYLITDQGKQVIGKVAASPSYRGSKTG